MVMKGARQTGRGYPKGMCPVCRTMQRLLVESGKVGVHGRPKPGEPGCAGAYQRPVRVNALGEPVDGGTVVGMKADDDGPSAQGTPNLGGRA